MVAEAVESGSAVQPVTPVPVAQRQAGNAQSVVKGDPLAFVG